MSAASAIQRMISQKILNSKTLTPRYLDERAAARSCPMVISIKLKRKKIAAASVAATAIALFFQKLRLSRQPCAIVSASIKLTKPEEALQIVASNPSDKNFVEP